MFLYTKYFLVFLSISVLSPISAMNNNKICVMNNNNKNNLISFLPIEDDFYSSHDSKFLVPKNKREQEKEQLSNIKSLLQKGFAVDLNLFEIGPLKKSIMCAAAEHGDVELVKLLLERGVDINTRNRHNGNTALYESIAKSNDFIREYLLQKGADPNTITDLRVTPLRRAMLEWDASAIKSLIKYGANIDGCTANEFVGGNACTNFNLKKEYYSHIKTVLLILNKCNEILYNNHHLRFLILSYLPEYHCHPGLYKELQKRKYALKPFTLHIVDEHIKIVQEILHITNKDNKNILELFPSITELNEKLLSDAAELKQKYPNISSIQRSNLAFGILKQYYLFKPEYIKFLIPKDILLVLGRC